MGGNRPWSMPGVSVRDVGYFHINLYTVFALREGLQTKWTQPILSLYT